MNMISFFPFQPTQEQEAALTAIEQFVQQEDGRDFFILKGSAGTGKTSLLKAVCDYITDKEEGLKLAAPTGRAAKVVGRKTDCLAKTIHGMIYIPEPIKNGGGIRMVRKRNTEEKFTLFIIDEASMISDYRSASTTFVTPNPLLADLLDFVKKGNANNKVLFVGDAYQLPPVVPYGKKAFSPALSSAYLEEKFNWKGNEFQLNQVMRQKEGSYILQNATNIRQQLLTTKKPVSLNYNNVYRPTQALTTFLHHFEPESLHKIAIVANANRDVNWFNQKVRERLGYNGKSLMVNDAVMLKKNWYAKDNVLYSGESGIVERVHNREEYAGLKFVDVTLAFRNGEGHKFTIDTKVLLDALHTYDGNLLPEKERLLFAESMKRNATFRESQNPIDDAYMGAIRLRYGYALTCHKAQGGEWDNVILHPWYRKDDLRWLYTAVTRAKKELYSWAA